jgi:hypothetical protein
MNNKEVIRLPASEHYTPIQALQSVLNEDLDDVLVIGYDKSGELIIRSSKMNRADALFMIEKARDWTLNGGV